MSKSSNLSCTACGKSAKLVKKLVELSAAPPMYVCDKCLDISHAMIHRDDAPAMLSSEQDEGGTHNSIPSPREMKAYLDDYVIGQDHAKEVLAVAVYNHYKRLRIDANDIEVDKSNILLCGPTGVGKTLLAQTIARMLDVPFAIADATSLTESGYVGEDVESVIGRLLSAANNDIKLCETGIIFLDEIDKKSTRSGTGRDVSGEGVQQALLKLLEGSDVMVTPTGMKKSPNTEMVKINTRNILFIVGGAFVGLDKIIAKSLDKGKSSIGFGSKSMTDSGKVGIATLLRQVEPEHLISFGIIPELIGRLPVIAALDELTEDQLIRVMTEPKNALVKQFTKMFDMDGVDLEFAPESLIQIAQMAIKRKTGGRALRSVLESRLLRIQFDLPDLAKQGAVKVVIHEGTIQRGDAPFVLFEDLDAARVHAQ